MNVTRKQSMPDFTEKECSSPLHTNISYRIRGWEIFVFRKISRVLFSCNSRFEICHFVLLPTNSCLKFPRKNLFGKIVFADALQIVLNYIRVATWSLKLKLRIIKLESWFVLWLSFLLMLCFIIGNLLSCLEWDAFVRIEV